MTTLVDWRPAPRAPHLADGGAHVWRIAVGPGVPAELYWPLLSPDERARAVSFAQDVHRASYVRSHGAMRMILAGYASTRPEGLRFQFGPFGKPSLAPEGNPERLEFNLSHSGDLALLAVARGRAVGVDIARRDEGADHVGIAERYFSPVEKATLLALGGTAEAFYSTWTRKEAYVKATGLGLSRGLYSFDVDAASQWTMVDLAAQEGYAAALVVANPVGAVTLFDAPAFETALG